MKKRILLAALLAFVPALSAAAQTNGVRDRTATDGPITPITDGAQISARFQLIAGEWNFLYATLPPGRLAPVIHHIVFGHTDSGYVATLLGMKADIRSDDSKYIDFTPPDIYKLTEVDDAVEGGFPRTQLVFQNAFTNAQGQNLTGSFVIFLVPKTGRIIGIDYADFPTGDSTATPLPDGFWAGVRGNVSGIDAFLPTALDLFQQYSAKTDTNEQSAVIARWSGYGH